jgi:putative FmdB family regulatory protein
MPTYDYRCNACGDEFDLYQSFVDKVKRTCKKCGQKKLERLIGCGLDAFCHNVTTIGQQGERNAKKAGKTKIEEMTAQRDQDRRKAQKLVGKDAGKKPWWRESEKPLDLKKIKDVKKYIERGEK